MKISVAASEFPNPEGTAAGRDLWAWCHGAIALGHDVDVWCWCPFAPKADLPDWARWEPVHPGPMWRAHLRSLLRPHNEQANMGWEPREGAIALADHVPSFPAVARFARSVSTIHYRALLDARAVGKVTGHDVQMARCERRAGREADLVFAYSDRVAQRLHKRAALVPIACPLPESPFPLVDDPVAAVLADWSWAPNRVALRALLKAWEQVVVEVTGAQLLVAGRNLDPSEVGVLRGVKVLGEVGSSADVLSESAVFAFPCPNSSGPKVKIIEALGSGLPVVTSAAGLEGVFGPDGAGALVGENEKFAAALSSLLADPERRASLASGGREAVLAHHSPLASAEARLAVLRTAFGDSSSAPATPTGHA
jgi:glycosyltransferase involved in cell wall biosynthesis